MNYSQPKAKSSVESLVGSLPAISLVMVFLSYCYFSGFYREFGIPFLDYYTVTELLWSSLRMFFFVGIILAVNGIEVFFGPLLLSFIFERKTEKSVQGAESYRIRRPVVPTLLVTLVGIFVTLVELLTSWHVISVLSNYLIMVFFWTIFFLFACFKGVADAIQGKKSKLLQFRVLASIGIAAMLLFYWGLFNAEKIKTTRSPDFFEIALKSGEKINNAGHSWIGSTSNAVFIYSKAGKVSVIIPKEDISVIKKKGLND